MKEKAWDLWPTGMDHTAMSGFLRALGAMGLCAALLVGGSISAEQDTPKQDPGKVNKDKAFAKGRFTGRLVQVDGHSFAVEVKQKIPQLNAQAAANIANSRRQLLTTKDPNQIVSIQLDIAKNQQNLYTYKDEVQKIELEAVDNAKVRTMILPLAYDDKGKMRKLTDKEKRNLRGPDLSLPGYTADFDGLKPDQQVEIYLAKSKSAPAPAPKPKDKDASDEPKRLKATMIVILADSSK